MNYLVTAALMGWLIGDKIPAYAYTIGEWDKVLHPLTAAKFGDRIEYLLNLYAPEINYVQLNLLDSHDTPRFLTTAGENESALRLAYLFLITFIGAPCIYYGDEIGLIGGPDPECRKPFPWDERTWNHDLYSYMKDLVHLRRSEAALRRGTYQRIYSDEDVIVYVRQYGEDTIIVALNTASEIRQPIIDTTKVQVANGELRPLFGSAQAGVQNWKITNLRINPRSGVVLKLQG
jgi:glycosidase